MAKSADLPRILSEKQVDFTISESLAAHCTFRIGGAAWLFLRPDTVEKLKQALTCCRSCGVRYYLLGNGSNLLFADEGFDGAVIDLTALSGEPTVEDTILTAQAGCSLAALCRAAQQKALSGLEFAYGIPGTLGGAVYMNAGAYGGEMAEVVLDASVLTQSGEVITVSAEQLAFSYRHSAVEENGWCVLSARLRLAHGDSKEIANKMEEIIARRRDKQPLDKPSAGSTFKRPEGAYAAALIEQCGLKGYRVGGAAVSEKHSGFVVNLGGASCKDVLSLCEQVCRTVKEKTGYTLEKEIRVVR